MNQQQFATYSQPSAQQQQMYAARTNSGYGQAGQFASVGRTASISMGINGGGMPPLYAWTPPSPQEHQYYDVLFSVADEEQRNAIGGRLAVMFFSRSNADKQTLREIWNIADSQQKGELSRNEFYVAMRLISMAQRGEAINVQRFFELATTLFPLPVLEGVPPPPQLQQQQQHQQQQQMPTVSMGASGYGGGGASMAPPAPVRGGGYAITDEEKTRYDAIFAQYDADNDGFLLGGEAVNLFQMSGLDRNALREIWALADRGQDSKLDVKEFYVAMHLIVCASKRALPVPPQLPQELIDSAFGASRGSFTAVGVPQPNGDFAGAGVSSGVPSQGGSIHSSSGSLPPAQQEQTADSGGDPFAGLSPTKDAQVPRLGSFSSAQQQPSSSSTPVPEHQGSFHGTSGIQQPTPPGSARGSFYGVSVPTTPTQDNHSGAGGFERTNSPSMGSFSSGVHAPAQPSVSNFDASGGMGGGAMNHHGVSGHGSGMMIGGYGGAPPPQMMVGAPPYSAKPFLSDEEEVQAVRELEQQNDEVAKTLASIEKKQSTIETLAEKLRELDQLRHDLVTLAMKRESVRAANNAAAATSSSSSSSAPSAGEHSAELQTKRAIEKSLQDLIESEKQNVQKLQQDLSGLESELQNSLSSSLAAMSMSSPAPVSQGGLGADYSFASPSSSASSSAFAAPTSQTSFQAPPTVTTSAGFDSFGDFGSKSAAASSFDAFASFDFN